MSVKLGIEPVVLLYSTLLSLTSHGLLQDVISHKQCIIQINCTTVVDNEFLIQDNYEYYYRLLESIPALLPCLLLGGWSDYHGRLPLTFLVLCGDILKNVLILLVDQINTWSVSYILIASSISGITGNGPLMLLACIARGCDITEPRGKSKKISVLLGMWWLGQGCGYVALAYRQLVVESWTHQSFMITVVCGTIVLEILLLAYLRFALIETVPDFGDYNGRGWRTLVLPVHINGTVNSFFKVRFHNARCCLLMLICALIIRDIVVYGEQSIKANYLSLSFDLNYHTYSLINGGVLIFMSITVILCLILVQKCQITDITIGVVGCMLMFLSSLLYMFISKNLHGPVYFAFVLYGFVLFIPTAVISLLSKIVHTSEAGSLLAGVSTVEAIIPVLASILYREMYRFLHCELTYLIYVFSMLLAFVSLFLFLFLKKYLNPCFIGYFENSERVALFEQTTTMVKYS